MIVIPFKTDSAIDYRPWGTVLLIAANVAVAYFLGFPVEMVPDMWGELPEEPPVNSWMLEYGEFRPLTWLTSVFVHAGYVHLIGNMIFLWIFGLVVEGYVGWTRFLPLYLAIGAGQCAIEQVLMLGAEEGTSIGASSAVFGLMVISALWAPRNKFTVFIFWVTFWIGQIRILWICLYFVGLDALYVILSGFDMSTPLLHSMGAALGLCGGLLMLRMNWVDCAGWDYLSLRRMRKAGRRPGMVLLGEVEKVAVPDSLLRMRDAMERKDGAEADDICARLQQADASWVPPRVDHLKLADLLLRTRETERAFERLEEFLRIYPKGPEAVRIKLAYHLLRAGRAGRALEHLARLDKRRLTDVQRTAMKDLEAKANAACEEENLELE